MKTLSKAIVFLGLFVFVICSGSDDTKTSKTKNPPKMQKFVTYSYNDPLAGIEVFRLLIPGDWKAEGAINWVAVPALPAKVNFRFYDTKSRAEFNLFPAQDYFWTDNQGFLYTNPPGSLRFGTPVAQPIDLHTAFTRVIIPKFRGGVSDLKIIEEKEVPDLAKLAKGPPAEGVTALAEAGKMRIEYTENGKEMEEEFYAAVSQFIINLPGSYYSPGYYINYWYIDLIFSFRAEKGKLDAQTKLFQTMLYSLQVNPQWYAKVANVKEYLAQLVIQNIQATGRMSQIIAQASSEMREDQQRAWEYRQGVNEKIAQNFSDYIRGVDQYYDPFAEKRVELPTGYKNVWSNNLGEYILTDDPNYNPNVGSNLNWQEIHLAR
ncbi:MAG: hypothetical protein ABIL69_10670 [candidate division WOR-3 bacterium]